MRGRLRYASLDGAFTSWYVLRQTIVASLLAANAMNDRELLQALLDSPSSHAIVVTDLEGRVLLWNRGASRIFQYTATEIIGQTADALYVPNDRKNLVPSKEMQRARSDGCANDFRWHQRKDASTFWGDGMMYPVLMRNGDHIGYMKILRDATEQKLREDEHTRLAFVDDLTGLPNRAELHRRMVDMMASAQRRDELLAMHMFDLDGFKDVNDTRGHAAGDQLLRRLSARIRAALRDTDLLARLGGDEFAIVQPGVHSIEDAAVLAQRMLECLARPFDVDGREVHIAGSMGISIYPSDATQMDQMMSHADVAMYQAKAAGGGQYRFYEASHEVA